MRPSYDPTATADDEAIDIDDSQVFWDGAEKFTGVLGETLPGGDYEFQSYRDGVPDGPGGVVTPDGDLVVEEWYRRNFLHGVTRRFRADGTLASAVGYEYGHQRWTVRFELDGATAQPPQFPQPGQQQRAALEVLRARVGLPPVVGPEAAGDLSAH